LAYRGVASNPGITKEGPNHTQAGSFPHVSRIIGGAGIVLSVTRCESVVILEGPADHVTPVRDGLVQSGLPSTTIIARPVNGHLSGGPELK